MANVALESGFFNSVGGDRVYDAESFSRYFEGILSNGYFPNDTGFKVLPNPAPIGSGAPSVLISVGKAYYNGMWVVNDVVNGVYSMGTGQNLTPGYYHIYLCFDKSDAVRTVSLQCVLNSSPSASWVLPANTTDKFYMKLATVTNKLTQQPIAADIVDERPYCGVNGINVGTSGLVDKAVTLAKIADECKGSIAATTAEALRKLGTGSKDAAAGNHTHPVDAAPTTGSFRTLGAGAIQAAAGNHTHPIDQNPNVGSFRTLGTAPLQAASGNHAHDIDTLNIPIGIGDGKLLEMKAFQFAPWVPAGDSTLAASPGGTWYLVSRLHMGGVLTGDVMEVHANARVTNPNPDTVKWCLGYALYDRIIDLLPETFVNTWRLLSGLSAQESHSHSIKMPLIESYADSYLNFAVFVQGTGSVTLKKCTNDAFTVISCGIYSSS